MGDKAHGAVSDPGLRRDDEHRKARLRDPQAGLSYTGEPA